MESHIDKLKVLNDFVEERKRRLSEWNEKLIPSIESYLKKVAALDDDLNFEINDSIVNNQTLILKFSKKPSGWSYNPDCAINQSDKERGLIFIDDGYLGISMSYSGDINAWFSKPTIEGFLFNHEDAVYLDVIDQSDCNYEWLEKTVNRFFDEMLNWRKNDHKRMPIGF